MRREPTYDPEADAAYIPLSDAKPHEAEEVAPGVILDYTEDGRVVGIEIMHASKTLADGAWSKWRKPNGDEKTVHAAE
jgi:uncharacterized protein YuzE